MPTAKEKTSKHSLEQRRSSTVPYDVITSMSRDYYEKCGYRLIKTFLHYFPKNKSLHVWTEDGIPVDDPRIIQHDLNKNEFYNKFTLNCSKTKCARLSIKVGAQYEASKILERDTLVWLDADVWVGNFINDLFVFKITPEKCLSHYMGQHFDTGPETGFISYNRNHKEFHNFMEQFVEVYYSGDIFKVKPYFDTSAWWKVKNSMPDEYFKSLSSHLGCSHVFSGSLLSHWLGHAKGKIKTREPELVDKRAFLHINN